MPYTLFYHTACTKFLGRGHGPLMVLNEAGADFTVMEPGDDAPKDGIGFAVPMVEFPGGASAEHVEKA